MGGRGGLGPTGRVRPGPEPGPHPSGTGRHAGYGQGGDRMWRMVWNGIHGCWVKRESPGLSRAPLGHIYK